MRRALALCSLVVAGACAREWERFEVGADGSGGGAGTLPIEAGTCFPGAKACPDTAGALICLSGADPVTGCASSSCDPCFLPHASAKCSAFGGCAIDHCDPGFFDCNGDPADGCETNVDSDPKNCGACATDCSAGDGGADWLCRFGSCFPNQCGTSTLADCDGKPSNMCEINLATDPVNCGFCGKVCALPNSTTACSQGVCVVTTCTAGWANCDGNDANGCEANLKSDKANCGKCSKTCASTNGVSGCLNGGCAILCTAGFANCDLNAANGCEVDTQSDILHCGGCWKPCKTACFNGQCV